MRRLRPTGPLVGFAVVGLLLAAPAPPVLATPGTAAAAAPSAGVVINEVYGGGGNSGATFTRDFIELANRGSAPVDLAGWSVQYHPAAAGPWQATPLSGTLAPGGYLVVAEAPGAGGTTDVPAQISGSIAMSSSAGTVALTTSTTLLGCTDSIGCTAGSVDLVGYGNAGIAEGAPVPGAANTRSVGRRPSPDTDVNAADFTTGDPTPGAANAGPVNPPPVSGDAGPLRIHDIQGTSFVSPVDGHPVGNVPGVVTGVRAAASPRGFFLQDPNPDADPATSEGIFVYMNTPDVAAGDAVLVSGTVKDFYPDGAPAVAQALSITEITGPTVIVLSSGHPLPAPELITPGTIPDQFAPDLGGASIETTPITPARSALDFWESREGMRVEIDDARVVGPTSRYGEQYVTSKPGQDTSFRGGTLLTGENAIPSGRIEVVPLVASPAVDVADVYTGPTIGPVDYSRFGGFLIAATQLGPVHHGGLTPGVATTPTRRQLSIATYNVENLAPADPAAKYAALAGGIVSNLAAPDIVALEEVQDNDAAADDGVVAADRTLIVLTGAITAAGGPHYQWREIDPANDQDGGQPGGNIRTVLLFNPDRVAFVDRGDPGIDRTHTATTVTGRVGDPRLTLSPGRIDPGNPAWNSSRKPLVAEFRFQGRPVFVIANHFDSKGGDQSAEGRYQYPARRSEVQRQAQAALVHSFVMSILACNLFAQTVVLGDLNDFQFSPALATVRTGRADGRGFPALFDLIDTLPANRRYTYVYQGVSQVLDHILLTPGTFLTGAVQYEVVHLNSEFADQTSDHDPQVVRLFGPFF